MSKTRRPGRRFRWGHDRPARKTSVQGAILAGLNALQVLDEQAPSYLREVLHYGPASFAKAGWAAALVWSRKKGYQHYATLTLYGVWVVQQGEHNDIQLGHKTLHYSAPIYNPESYFSLIRQDFRTYYGDDGSPPPTEQLHYHVRYDPTQRLALRATLEAEIVRGLREMRVSGRGA